MDWSRFLRRRPQPDRAPSTPEAPDLKRQQIEYLLSELSDLRSKLRVIAPPTPDARQTKDSFSYQWRELTESAHMIGDPAFEQNMFALIRQYTGRDASSFRGQTVLDAGCGNGRWSYAFTKAGAHVTAVDQSETGIVALRHAMEAANLKVETQVADILDGKLPGGFDFVWCFGVVHHTGDTRRAIANVASAVRPGGQLYLMVYGEPVEHGDFVAVNLYARLRRETASMTFDEEVEYLAARYPPEQVHGYFDAVSPTINDLHRFDELHCWLTELRFCEIHKTVPGKNHHVMSRRQ